MCAKYILESVMYWAEEYHMDGFRFDLMGLLDVELVNRIRHELDKRFGEGEILLYGEPWNAGISPMEKGHTPCLKENIQYLDKHVGIFCDNTRDAVKGHVFSANKLGFVNGGSNCEKDILNAVSAWSGTGDECYAKAPSHIITYVSAHDNLALWDKLIVTLKPGKPFTNRFEEVVRANKMAAAVYFTCQGSIFFLGGEKVKNQLEMLESAIRHGCIGQLPEIYDGDNPSVSKGCFAQAWSVGEILRVYHVLEERQERNN